MCFSHEDFVPRDARLFALPVLENAVSGRAVLVSNAIDSANRGSHL